MTLEIKRQLKSLKRREVNPSDEWLAQNRSFLVSQIQNTIIPKKSEPFTFEKLWSAMSVFLPRAVVYNFVRPVAVLMAAAMVCTSGWIVTVDASSNSLPGDLLYPAKKATEKTQMILVSAVGDKKTETKLHVEFAKRRASEAKKIVAGNDPQKIKNISSTIKEIKKEMESVQDKLDEVNTAENKIIESAGLAKNISQNVEQINNDLSEVKAILLIETTTTTAHADLTVEVSETKDLVKETSVKAVEVMVAKHLEGDNSVTKEEVKEVINNQLQSAAQDVVESKQNVVDVQKAIESVKTEVAKSEAAKTSETTTAVNDLTIKMDDVAKKAGDAAKKSETITVETSKMITEGQQLLSTDNLAQAVDKIKEATKSAAAAEQVKDTAIKEVQTVFPVVTTVVKDGEIKLLPTPTSTIPGIVLPAVTGTTTVSASTTVAK